MFRIMSYYELTSKNQNSCRNFIEKYKSDDDDDAEDDDDSDGGDDNKYQYLVVSAEPYDNIAIVIPNKHEIDKPLEENKMSDSYWWYWDNDTKNSFYSSYINYNGLVDNGFLLIEIINSL